MMHDCGVSAFYFIAVHTFSVLAAISSLVSSSSFDLSPQSACNSIIYPATGPLFTFSMHYVQDDTFRILLTAFLKIKRSFNLGIISFNSEVSSINNSRSSPVISSAI